MARGPNDTEVSQRPGSTRRVKGCPRDCIGITTYQETKFELLVNLKVAQALGLTIPTSLLVRTNEVIE
jgi:ABC-type uncharacterized transport system substrate-binding protein